MREGRREGSSPPAAAAALHISKLGLLFGGAFQPEEEEEEEEGEVEGEEERHRRPAAD